ncbi:MAG TPA: FAD-dependent oxidoreductase [Gemmatimonadales bacterium]|nr:FAD-dependent oxidoreductase [Gemmatimonadales bacterium]
MRPAKTRLLLVGAGHAHLEVLRRLVFTRPEDLAVTLVSLEPRHFYSGMTPGYLAGQYRLEDISFDVPAIARRAGAECVLGRAARLEPSSRSLVLEDGRTLAYDLLSLNIGSLLAGADEEPSRGAQLIKPLHRAAALKARLEALALADPATPARVVVIGAGAGGVEVACAAAAVMDRASRAREITLLDRGDRLPAGYGARFQARTVKALHARGISTRVGVRVRSVRRDAVELEDGAELPCDLAIWLTGPVGDPFLATSGLPSCPRGFLWTDDMLRSLADRRIFAVGDCGTPASYPTLAKSGVYAVREAPVLWRNLLASARTARLATFRPPREFLSILNTGDGRALLHYKGLISWSRWAWRLKDRIDRRFMRKYQQLAR